MKGFREITIITLLAPLIEGFAGGGGGVGSSAAGGLLVGAGDDNIIHSLRKATIRQPLFLMSPTKKRYSSSTTSQLYSSELPFAEQQPIEEEPLSSLQETNPIQFLKIQSSKMDMNAIINTAILLIVSVAVLNNVATVDSDIMRGWTAEEMAVRIPIDNWNSYSTVLEKAPLFTKAVTSATVYTIGDMISQATEGKNIGEVDRPRVFRSLLAGLIGHGPMSHVWYDFSEDIFENVMHLQGWFGTFIKVAIDQTTWGPIWNNTYILLLGLMKFDKLENIFSEMKRTTIPLIVSGLKLWPLAHIVTYGLVPVENRLLWVDMVEIIWVTILATAAAGGSGNEGEGGHSH